MKRLGVLAAGCGAFAATAALGAPAAIAQTSFITSIVYTSHDTPDAAQAKLSCDSPASTTNCHIYVMNTDGAGLPLTNGPANDLDPAFSPDGTRIAFARAVGGPQGTQYDIYVMDANGTNVRQLTDQPRDDRYPAWSPDGTRIAFRGYPPVGGASIFTMNPDGGDKRVIQNTGGGDQPTYSPDGTRVAYAGTYQNGTDPATGLPTFADDIFVQPVAAGDTDMPLKITNDPAMSDRYPSWQPTAGSNRILFRKVNTTNDRELWQVDAANGASTTLLVEQTANIGRAASWSPTGTDAAFVSYREANSTRSRDQEIWLGTVGTDAITNARQLTINEITDDQPKMGNVPVTASAVPQTTSTGGAGGGVVGTVTGGGTAITVGGGTTAATGGRPSLSLKLIVPKQKLGRSKTLKAFAQCNAGCAVNVTGSTRLKVAGKTRTLRLLRTKKTINANVRTRLLLRIPTTTLRSVRSNLKRRKPVTFSISASARTTTGQFTPAAVRKLTVRR